MTDSEPSQLIAYYGDDFTGSTDVMDALARHGVPTVLFLAPPTREDLARFPGARVVGVAGMSRTMSPGEMDAELPVVFERLAQLGATICHYKVCSTFDSSPTVGSIGRAIDWGARIFRGPFVPLVVGAPTLRRYTLFGNLFASVAGETFRLDRHPTMSRHPITPMTEGDLRLHLQRQTDQRVGLMDILALDGSDAEVDARFSQLSAGAGIVLFDVLDEARLAQVGRLVWRAARSHRGSTGRSFFVAASSGLQYALVAHWRASGLLPATPVAMAPAAERPAVAVISGSCSPVTESQIARAIERGWVAVDVEAARLLDPTTAAQAREAAVRAAVPALAAGRSVVLFSARGPDDARIKATEATWRARHSNGEGPGRALGEELGKLARALLEAHPITRLALAGGDTSGHGARSLGIDALEMIAPLAPGGPLCRAASRDARVDGLEIVLKGGQVGTADFFESVRLGRLQ